MKKFLMISLTVFLLIGCGNNKDENKQTNDSKTQSISKGEMLTDKAIKEKSFALSYKFPEGKKLKYKLTSVATTNQKIETDTVITQEVTQTTDYIFDIESLGEKGDNYKLKIFINSIKMNSNFNGEMISYDSEKPDTNSDKKNFAEYASLTKTNFEVSINPQGRITGVENVNGIINNYLEIQEVPSITDEERKQFAEQIKSQVVQPLSQQMFNNLPENKIKIDSSWILNYESPMSVYTLKNTSKSVLQGIKLNNDDSLAVIKTDLSVEAEGDGNVTQNNVQYSFSKPKITGFADVLFSLNDGHIVKSESTSQTEMTLIVSGNDPATGPQTARRTDLSVNKNYLELISVE